MADGSTSSTSSSTVCEEKQHGCEDKDTSNGLQGWRPNSSHRGLLLRHRKTCRYSLRIQYLSKLQRAEPAFIAAPPSALRAGQHNHARHRVVTEREVFLTRRQLCDMSSSDFHTVERRYRAGFPRPGHSDHISRHPSSPNCTFDSPPLAR